MSAGETCGTCANRDGRTTFCRVWYVACPPATAACARYKPTPPRGTDGRADAGGRGTGDHDAAPAREVVESPEWYAGPVETIDKIEAIVDGLPAREAYMLGQVVRYADRAGRKDDPAVDLGKANNYAHRLVCGRWRDRG